MAGELKKCKCHDAYYIIAIQPWRQKIDEPGWKASVSGYCSNCSGKMHIIELKTMIEDVEELAKFDVMKSLTEGVVVELPVGPAFPTEE